MPYLIFALSPALPVAAAAVVIASAGFSAGLLLQERLVELTPAANRGQALGLHSSGMSAMHGIGAVVAGGLAEYLQVGHAMAVMAALSVIVTIALTPALHRDSRLAAADATTT